MIDRRVYIVIVGMVLFLTVLVLRLISIQVKQHRYYLEIANRQQNKSQKVLAERGIIKDRNNELLAYSKNDVDVYVDYNMLKRSKRNQKILSESLMEIFGKKLDNYDFASAKNLNNVCLEKKVPKIKVLPIENIGVDAIRIEENHTRVYPYKNLASHVIGYVNKDNMGIMGIEEKFNKELKGIDGIKQIERDVLGRTVTVKDNLSKKPISGQTVVLTINKTFQSILESELKRGFEEYEAKDAVGIIMNPNNGEVLALANYPDFDPSNYSKYENLERRNRAITDSYEPGSTMKPIVMSILLDKKLIRENEVINTENGVYEYKNAKIRDTHKYQALTAKQVIEYSSNIGMAKLSSRIDDDDFYKYLRNFGFGNYTNIGISGEVNGMMKKPSQFGSTTKAYMSFGYEITSTPIQLIAAYSALINGGTLYKPFIVKRIEDQNGTVIKDFSPIKIRDVISTEASKKIKEFMIGAVENGTAKSALIKNMKIGGKTGTSQRLIDGGYSKEEYNTSFIGFFPAESPKYICLIIYISPQKAKYGGLVAAPVFKNIAEKICEIEPESINNHDNSNQIKKVDEIFSDLKKENKNMPTEFSDLSVKVHKNANQRLLKKNIMPDLTDQSLRSALTTLKELNVKIKVIGNGKVVGQSIAAGTKINENQTCTLTCKKEFNLENIKLN